MLYNITQEMCAALRGLNNDTWGCIDARCDGCGENFF